MTVDDIALFSKMAVASLFIDFESCMDGNTTAMVRTDRFELEYSIGVTHVVLTAHTDYKNSIIYVDAFLLKREGSYPEYKLQKLPDCTISAKVSGNWLDNRNATKIDATGYFRKIKQVLMTL